ncbi:MAG: FAD-binding protein [Streptosporangiaceae bacterium]
MSGTEAVRHVETLFFGKTDRSVAEAYVRGLNGLRTWMGELGGEAERPDNAGSPEDLAGHIGLDPHVLPRTLADSNEAARSGRDEEFGCRPEYISALDLTDLYAIELWPAAATPSRGPGCDGRASGPRPDGNPVPGLYAAGGAGTV